ncbi:MAG: sulfite exporter TauE/SafE family protein [Fibrobacteria bacterium]|nr:sulfite exporter TauE/SafE family protein [Fibrobacteria bacterium]
MSLFSTDAIQGALQGQSLLAYPLVFGAGLITSLTPCVYPLIPVTVSILGAKKAESRAKAFLLALSYVLGIAVTYAALGAFAALTGALFGEVASNPWVNIGMAVLLGALSLNMLEVFQFRLPGFAGASAGQGRKAGYLSNFALGLAFGLVASPCTAPVLGAILLWVGQTGSVVRGSSLLFVFALGMGAFLLAIGTFSSLATTLPRSGDWMIRVKTAMGVLLLGMAGWFCFQAGQLW